MIFLLLKRFLQIGKSILLVGSVSFGLLAVQLLPTLEFAALSTRGSGIPFERLTVNSLHPNQLWTLLFPLPFPLFLYILTQYLTREELAERR